MSTFSLFPTKTAYVFNSSAALHNSNRKAEKNANMCKIRFKLNLKNRTQLQIACLPAPPPPPPCPHLTIQQEARQNCKYILDFAEGLSEPILSFNAIRFHLKLYFSCIQNRQKFEIRKV